MRKRILVWILTIAVVMSVTGGSFVYADNLSNINSQISDKKSELSQGRQKEKELKSEISQLTEKIDGMQDEIDKLQSEINNTEFKITAAQNKLSKLQNRIEKQNNDLNDRLRNMYMNDNTSFVEVLLNSGSLSELLVNLDLIKRIHKGDKEVLEQLQVQHEQVEKQKKELDNLNSSLKSQQGEVKVKQESLNADKSALNKKRQAVAADNAELSEEIADLQAAADALTAQIKDYGNSDSPYSGSMIWPVSGHISCEYGYRYCPYHGYELHTGIDIAVGTGTSVKAASSGVVRQAYYNSSYGNMVLIDNGGGIYTLYAHNSRLLVSAGQKVSQGQVIARSGNTGNSTGPHVHFEVRVNGQYVNPRNYL